MTKGGFMEGTEALQAYFNRDYTADELQKMWSILAGYSDEAFLAACSHAMKCKEFLPTDGELLAFTDSLKNTGKEPTITVKHSDSEECAHLFQENMSKFLCGEITRQQFADRARELCKQFGLTSKIDLDGYWAKHGMPLDAKPTILMGRGL